jgi:hypothetical protein
MTTLNLNPQARAVVSALESFDKASQKCSEHITLAFQLMCDAASVAGVKRDEPSVKAFMAEIRGAEAFLNAVAVGMLESKTVTEYAQSAGRAYFHNVPFTADLKNKPAYALPWSKAGKGKKLGAEAGEAGKVQTTDRAELDKTACKLLAQCRMLGLNGLAADLLDVLVEGLDGFKEPTAH